MANSEMNRIMGYRHRSQVWTTVGMWAWLIHRITGLGLLLYIFLHIALMSTSLLRGEKAFDTTLSVLMGTPVFELLDTLLLAAVLYHSFNGIRILLFDMGIGIRVGTQKIFFWISMGISAVLWLWAVAIRF
jgi:succinate dehydrogenase / fumarate reductase cytochrome b subunit